jgi:hypothetical protein
MPLSHLSIRHLISATFAIAVAAPVGAQSFTAIDFPNAAETVALDVNASGDIVGRYTSAVDGTVHGFLRSQQGELTSIDFPGANFTVAAGINARGDIAGQFRLPGDDMRSRRGFVLSEDQFTEINPPGSRFTNVLGIGPSGLAVGRYCTILPCTGESTYVRGFLLREGVFTTIDVGALGTNAWKITPQQEVLGGYTAADGERHAFVLTPEGYGTVEMPPGISLGIDNGGMNPRGDIVGFYCDREPCLTRSVDTHGFVLSKGEFTSVDVPGAMRTVFLANNARGDIVGFYVDPDGVAHGLLLGGWK